MTKALRLTKNDWLRAALLAQQGCKVTFHPNGDISVMPVDAGEEKAVDSVTEWRRKQDAKKAKLDARTA